MATPSMAAARTAHNQQIHHSGQTEVVAGTDSKLQNVLVVEEKRLSKQEWVESRVIEEMDGSFLGKRQHILRDIQTNRQTDKQTNG